MIYLVKVKLQNKRGETITSEIVAGDEAVDSYVLNSHQMRRALEERGITSKTKTKYDSWREAKVLSVDIIKEVRGLS